MLDRKHAEIGHELESKQESPEPELAEALDDEVGDDLLRLVFIACHPVLSTEARVALTLRLLGGLTTDEIARAFLVPESTIAQRIVRAKRTLSDKQGAVRGATRRRARRARLVGPRGHLSDLQRGLFRHVGRRLGAPGALSGRAAARPHRGRARAERAGGARPRGADGDPGVAAARARRARRASRSYCSTRIARSGTACSSSAGSPHSSAPSRSAVRSGRSRCRRRSPRVTRAHERPAETDWPRIASLYQALAQVTPSPIVELNRAVALSMAFGPAAGLALVDTLTSEPSLAKYHLLPSVRGDFLRKLGRFEEARVELERAASLTRNARERELLLERARGCAESAKAAAGASDTPRDDAVAADLTSTPRRQWRGRRRGYVSILLLVNTGGLGVYNGVTELSDAQTPLQQVGDGRRAGLRRPRSRGRGRAGRAAAGRGVAVGRVGGRRDVRRVDGGAGVRRR